MKVLDCRPFAISKADALSNKIKNMKEAPKLVIIYTVNNPSMQLYLSNKSRMLINAGCDVQSIDLSDKSKNDISKTIREYNDDKSIHGIIIQLPLRDDIEYDSLIKLISPLKDVDGLTDFNVKHNWEYDKDIKTIAPCTPLGIINFIMSELDTFDLSGYKALIISRSMLVGQPMLELLISKNCTVTMGHSRSNFHKDENGRIDISEYDFIIVGAGKPNLFKFKSDNVESIVFDVGINYLDGKLCGDVDVDNSTLKGFITPVPNGVGKLTCVQLLSNLIKAYELQNK